MMAMAMAVAHRERERRALPWKSRRHFRVEAARILLPPLLTTELHFATFILHLNIGRTEITKLTNIIFNKKFLGGGLT